MEKAKISTRTMFNIVNKKNESDTGTSDSWAEQSKRHIAEGRENVSCVCEEREKRAEGEKEANK